MSGRPGCRAKSVAFQVSGRPLLLCQLVVLLFCARAPYGDCHGGHRGLREADGQFTHRLVWHVVPVLCAPFPFLLGYVVVTVAVVPVGEVVTPVLRVEGFRVRGILGEHLENARGWRRWRVLCARQCVSLKVLEILMGEWWGGQVYRRLISGGESN